MRNMQAKPHLRCWTIGLSALLLAACGDSNYRDVDNGAAAPPSAAPTPSSMLLSSVDGGAGLLGEVSELPLAATDPATPFLKFAGTPWIGGEPAFTGHGLVFNGSDNKFYGVLDRSGADGLGVLISFDPATDKLSVLKSFVRRSWAAVTGVNGEVLPFVQPSRFARKPLLSPDGKSLLLRASNGGVRDRGALIHVNIDPTSASYLKETLVYSFFDYEKARGTYCESLRAIGDSGITEMAWGKDPGGAAVVYMAVGGVNIDLDVGGSDPTVPGNCHPYVLPSGRHADKILGRMFALKPGDASDLSKPWATPPLTRC